MVIEYPQSQQESPQRWWIWLLIVSIAGSVGGVVMALGSLLFPSAPDVIYSFVFGDGTAVTTPNRILFNVIVAIGGGLQAGVSAIIGFMACYPLRRGERWAWFACVTGLIIWLALDTGVTVWYFFYGYPQLWPKIVNDLGFVLMFGIP